jgi:hypothetical protein
VILSEKQTKKAKKEKNLEGTVQVIEHWLSKHESLCSNPSTRNKNKQMKTYTYSHHPVPVPVFQVLHEDFLPREEQREVFPF